MEEMILGAQSMLLGMEGLVQDIITMPSFPQIIMLAGTALALRGINQLLH